MNKQKINGEQVVEKLYGHAGKERIQNLAVFSENLAKVLVNGIGINYGSPILALKFRSVITIAVHMVLGDLVGMKAHFGNAIKAGITVTELKQIAIVSFIFSGVTYAQNTFGQLKVLCEELNIVEEKKHQRGNNSMKQTDKHQQGLAHIKQLFGQEGVKKIQALENFAPSFTEFVSHEFADICATNAIDHKFHSAIAIAATIAQNDTENFKSVLSSGLASGFTLDELKEIVSHLALYCGFPRSVHAMLELKEIAGEKT